MWKWEVIKLISPCNMFLKSLAKNTHGLELWFLVRTIVNGHWACVKEQCAYGERKKSGESLEMVKNGVECYFKRQIILQKFWNSLYFTEILKPMVFYKKI